MTSSSARMHDPRNVTDRDDTEFVQGFLDRGEPVRAGEYWCPEGVTIPDGYSASAARHLPDEGAAQMAMIRTSGGGGVVLKYDFGCVSITTGRLWVGVEAETA